MQAKARSDFAFEDPKSARAPQSVLRLPPASVREVPVPSLRALEIHSNQGPGEGKEARQPHSAGSSTRGGREVGLSAVGSKESTQHLAGRPEGRPDSGQGQHLAGSGQGHR